MPLAIKPLGWTMLAIAFIAACGSDRPLAEYSPPTDREAAIQLTLLRFQEGVNNRNVHQVGDLLDDRATLMVGRDRNQLAKHEYLSRLPQRLADLPPIGLGQPRITVADTSAKVLIYLTRGGSRNLVTFHLSHDGRRWLIRGWTY